MFRHIHTDIMKKCRGNEYTWKWISFITRQMVNVLQWISWWIKVNEEETDISIKLAHVLTH